MRTAVAVVVFLLVAALAIGSLQLLAAANRSRAQLADERIAIERLRFAAATLHRTARAVVRHDPDALFAFAEAQRAFDIGILDAPLRRELEDYQYAMRAAVRRHADGAGADDAVLAAFETELEPVRAFDQHLDERSAQLRTDLEAARTSSTRFARYAQLLVLAGTLAGVATLFVRRRRRPPPRSPMRREPVELAGEPRVLR